MSVRRLEKELDDLRSHGPSSVHSVQVLDESNLLQWEVLIIPPNPPYNAGAFRLELNFPPQFPFKPPKILFKTTIYHPNVGEKGDVCLALVSPENWKPATKLVQVMEALLGLIEKPEPDHPLRADIGEEFVQNYDEFMKKAEDFTVKWAEKRPSS